jgi:hypothetical protein
MITANDDNYRSDKKKIDESLNADDLINQIKDGLDITGIKTPR